MKGRMKGAYAALIALLVGAVFGVISSLIVTALSQTQTSAELYMADLETLNLFYKARNIQEYMEIGAKYAIPDYVLGGGPRFCGETVFDGRTIGVLKAEGCDLEVTPGLILNESGRLAELEAEKYEDEWKVNASSSGGKFCLSHEARLPFGLYSGKTCFDSPAQSEISEVLNAMKASYIIRSECACNSEYKVCWTSLGVLGGDYNFTFAVEENC